MKLGGAIPLFHSLSDIYNLVSSGISLVDYSEEDNEFVFNLFKKIKIDELGAENWPSTLLEPIINIQYNAFNTSIKNNLPDSASLIILFNNESAGQIIINESSDRILIVFIAVSENYRNKGIASEVINHLIKRKKTSGKKIHLHVANNNKASLLYKCLGFREIEKNDIGYLMEYN